jgi:hypothetical protein
MPNRADGLEILAKFESRNIPLRKDVLLSSVDSKRGPKMDRAGLGSIALVVVLFALVVGGVYAYQRSQSEVLVDSPAVRVERNNATGETKIEAPFTRVEKDQSGTRVQAPGVDVNVPKQPSENSGAK